MPHYYAASGDAIQLDEAPDSIGVRFDGETGHRRSQRCAALTPRGETAASRKTERRPPTTAVSVRPLHAAARQSRSGRAGRDRRQCAAEDVSRRASRERCPCSSNASRSCNLSRPTRFWSRSSPRRRPRARASSSTGSASTIVRTSEFDRARKILVPTLGAARVENARPGQPARRGRRSRGLCRAELSRRGAEAHGQRPAVRRTSGIWITRGRPNGIAAERRARARRVGASRRRQAVDGHCDHRRRHRSESPRSESQHLDQSVPRARAIGTAVTSSMTPIRFNPNRRYSTRRSTTPTRTTSMAHPAPVWRPRSATTAGRRGYRLELPADGGKDSRWRRASRRTTGSPMPFAMRLSTRT